MDKSVNEPMVDKSAGGAPASGALVAGGALVERGATIVETRPKLRPNGKWGGVRPGSGRKPKPKVESMLSKAYQLLDEATIPAINAVVELLESNHPMVRLKAAKIILSKRIPDLTYEQNKAPSIINIVHNYRPQTQENGNPSNNRIDALR